MSNPWLERWREGRTGWHEAAGNRGLKRHWRASGRNVLVPLCGKAHDLRWLADRGNRVTGVELSPLAAEAFFAEQELVCKRGADRGFEVFESVDLPLRILCGDYFAFEETGFDGHYDRGALVALPPELRERYARHTLGRLTADALQFVVTVAYDDALAEGPPFVVREAELTGYWPRLALFDGYDDSDAMPPKFRDAGLAALEERIWTTPE